MTARLVPENIIISDATVLINFLNPNRFELLLKIFESRLHITDVVRAEITKQNAELDKALEEGRMIEHKVSIQQTAHLVKHFPDFDAGEASCFVLAKENSWRIATDDGAAKQFIKRQLNPTYIVTTFDILLEGVGLGILKKEEAMTIVNEMETKARFIYDRDEHKRFADQLKNR